jgi:hypothetical protein
VKRVVAGKEAIESEGRLAEHPENRAAPAPAIFERSPKRFVVEISRLASATESQITALRAAFETLLEALPKETSGAEVHR